MKKKNDSINHPLCFISDNGRIFGQFYRSYDGTYHIAEYEPYKFPPRKYICGLSGQYFPGSRSEDEKRKKCEKCFSLLDTIDRLTTEKHPVLKITVLNSRETVAFKDLGLNEYFVYTDDKPEIVSKKIYHIENRDGCGTPANAIEIDSYGFIKLVHISENTRVYRINTPSEISIKVELSSR